MADPVIIDIPKGVWKKVAANVLVGFIDKMTSLPNEYYFTSRQAGNPTPAQIDPNHAAFDGIPKFLEGLTVAIQANEPSDIWILTLSADGKVKVTV